MHTPRGIQGVVRVTYQDGLTQSCTYQEGWVDTELHQGGARVADQEGWVDLSGRVADIELVHGNMCQPISSMALLEGFAKSSAAWGRCKGSHHGGPGDLRDLWLY